MWDAVRDLRAQRIGHGVRAVEDADLVRTLVERQIPLDVCPSSNVCTQVYLRIEAHPIKQLMDAGAIVTVNTDDPHMFGTNLSEEYRRVAGAFDLDEATAGRLVRNGANAALMPADRKQALHVEIDGVLAERGQSSADTDGDVPLGR